MIALSMVIVWPLPWLLCTRHGRREIGLRAPVSWWWLPTGSARGSRRAGCWCGNSLGLLWEQHRQLVHTPRRSVAAGRRRLPSRGVHSGSSYGSSPSPRWSSVPLGEEFLYRGFILRVGTKLWGDRAGDHRSSGSVRAGSPGSLRAGPRETLVDRSLSSDELPGGPCFGMDCQAQRVAVGGGRSTQRLQPGLERAGLRPAPRRRWYMTDPSRPSGRRTVFAWLRRRYLPDGPQWVPRVRHKAEDLAESRGR